MKKTTLAIAIGSLTLGAMAMGVASTAVAAEASGNIALSTDYKFRGISQSDGEAISGGFDVDEIHQSIPPSKLPCNL